MVVGYQVVLHSLGHAAQHANDEPAPAVAHGIEGFKAVYYLLFSVVAHAACVEEYGVGLVYVLAHFIVRHLHYRGHNLAVGHVHLAAVGFYVELFHIRFYF